MFLGHDAIGVTDPRDGGIPSTFRGILPRVRVFFLLPELGGRSGNGLSPMAAVQGSQEQNQGQAGLPEEVGLAKHSSGAWSIGPCPVQSWVWTVSPFFELALSRAMASSHPMFIHKREIMTLLC